MWLLLGPLAVAGLVILPGTWITFRLPDSALSFWPRLLIGAALSPLVVLAEFYALRLAGLPFGATAWIMVVLNLAAGYAVLRQAGSPAPPDRSVWAPILAIGIVCAFYLSLYYPYRAFSGHVWMHTDIAYQLINGSLRPESADLAGARLAYPWFGHVQQAALSYVMRLSPAYSYVWTNAVYLVVMLCLTWHVTAALGGNAQTRVWSLILLLFGVNFAGYWLRILLPAELIAGRGALFGDPRYAPWLRRFLFFEQPQQVLPMFMALLLLAVDRRPASLAGARWWVATPLLVAIGIIYPILFPAACGIIGALALMTLWRTPASWRSLVPLAGMIALGAIATWASVKWVTQDRAGQPDLHLSDWYSLKVKSVTLTIVMLPLLPGALLSIVRALRARRDAVLQLAISAAVCAVLYVAFVIAQGGSNEYKFVYPTAALLAPLAALALAPALARMGDRVLAPALLGLLVLSSPAFHRWYNVESAQQAQYPYVQVEPGGFDLQLAESESYAGVTRALRATPPGTVVVTRATEMHLPTLTQRSLYAPYANDRFHAYLNVDAWLQSELGYPPGWLLERRKNLHDLFEPTLPGSRAAALTRIAVAGRPLAFVVNESLNPDLDSVLGQQPGASQLYDGRGFRVWLLPPPRQVVP